MTIMEWLSIGTAVIAGVSSAVGTVAFLRGRLISLIERIAHIEHRIDERLSALERRQEERCRSIESRVEEAHRRIDDLHQRRE